MRNDLKYIYGPVPSWRLGSSLGIDLLSRDEKICSFDCIYCQLGRNNVIQTTRRLFVPVEDVVREIESLPDINIDHFTFSGRGEPTLASNLGAAITALRNIRQEKIAVITNSSLIPKDEIQKDLLLADLVIAKLDAATEDVFAKINRPAEGLRLDDIISALVDFRKRFGGRLALQVMFTAGNKDCAPDIARIARAISPDEVQINTPLRPCGEKPLSEGEMRAIKAIFDGQGLRSINVYGTVKKKVISLSDKDTLRRRGKET